MNALEAIGARKLSHQEFGEAIAKLPTPIGKDYRVAIERPVPIPPWPDGPDPRLPVPPVLRFVCKAYALDGRRFWLWDLDPEHVLIESGG